MKSIPSIFIGSSKECLTVARKLKEALSSGHGYSVQIWDDPEGIFQLGKSTLTSILTAPQFYDYSILLLAPDDSIVSRHRKSMAARDNVIFELGTFLGGQGRLRSFAVVVERHDAKGNAQKVKIPSDLAGEQLLWLQLTSRGTPEKSGLKSVVDSIVRTVSNQTNLSFLSPLPSTVLAITYYRTFLLPMCRKLLETNRLVLVDDQKTLNLGTKGFEVIVAIPRELAKGSREGQGAFKALRKLKVCSVDADARPFPFFVPGKPGRGKLTFFDVPTILRGCSEAIGILMPNPGASGKSKEQELVEAREAENFAETLQHMIDTDPEGVRIRDLIRLEMW